ncbi:hypothetical protein ANCDUO_01715 [Ancylostoma duodenale]|uniref:Uncharacterized protein n=1 Tax=Ancylostoma duodenale TaxID=51022 RepID=A0A0C2DDH7_9BILA|nr:hypothetical protein ANCDUO_01715 [Ancylostoma duodenale]
MRNSADRRIFGLTAYIRYQRIEKNNVSDEGVPKGRVDVLSGNKDVVRESTDQKKIKGTEGKPPREEGRRPEKRGPEKFRNTSARAPSLSCSARKGQVTMPRQIQALSSKIGLLGCIERRAKRIASMPNSDILMDFVSMRVRDLTHFVVNQAIVKRW